MNKETRGEVFWMGRRIADLSREELIKAVEFLAHSEADAREDASRWRRAGDPIKYLMDKATQP